MGEAQTPPDEAKVQVMKRRALVTIQSVAFSIIPLFVAGCSSAAPATSLFISRDSAGVSIWEHGDLTDLPSPRWTIGEGPIMVLGEEVGNDPFLFSRIQGAVLLTSGGVVVADGLSSELRYFAGDRTHTSTAGGEGSGPGEFTRLRNAFPYAGDSVAATDVMGARVSLFDSGGEWGRSATCMPASPSMTALRIEGALENGGFLARAMEQFQTEAPTAGYHREPSMYQLCGPEGEPGPVLKELPDLEFEVRHQDGRWVAFPLEMGRKAESVVLGDEVLVGVTDRLELWRYGRDGEMKGILRVGIAPTPMNEGVKELWIEHALADTDDPEEARQTRQRYRDRIWPDSLPVFSDLQGDAEGNLWVRQFVPEYDEGVSNWWVFGPDGSFLARANLPGSLRVYAIGSDFVLGAMADDLGVERIFRYRLEKGSSPVPG